MEIIEQTWTDFITFSFIQTRQLDKDIETDNDKKLLKRFNEKGRKQKKCNLMFL